MIEALTDDRLREWAELSRDGFLRFRACETLPSGRQFCVFVADGKIGRATGRFKLTTTLAAVMRAVRTA